MRIQISSLIQPMIKEKVVVVLWKELCICIRNQSDFTKRGLTTRLLVGYRLVLDRAFGSDSFSG